MTSIASRANAFGNKALTWFYKVSGGKVGGSMAGIPVMLLTVPGRTTGKPRTAPVSYFENGDSWLVVGSAAGSDHDPQWFRNLRAARQARVQIRRSEHDVDVRIAEGQERDDFFKQIVVKRAPTFAKYEKRTTRVIPIAVLTPRSDLSAT